MILNYKKFLNINEAVKYQSLNDDLMGLIKKSSQIQKLDTGEFIKNWVDENSNPPKKTEQTVTLEGLIQDADILEFYSKHTSEIDNLLNDIEFFSKIPNVNGLYQYVINGTKDAIFECISKM